MIKTLGGDVYTQIATCNGKRPFGSGWVLHGGVIFCQIDTLAQIR